MKIIKNAPQIPAAPPPPKRHDCQDEMRSTELTYDTYRRFGMVIQCSCGAKYEARPMTSFRWSLWGPGPGNLYSKYQADQYWRHI